MAAPISSQLIKITDNEPLVQKIKHDVLMMLRPQYMYITKEINERFNLKISADSVLEFINAQYNPLYGHQSPIDPMEYEVWRRDVKTRTDFIANQGREIFYFIDAYAAGGTTSQAEREILLGIQRSQEHLLKICRDKDRAINESIQIYSEWTKTKRDPLIKTAMLYNAKIKNGEHETYYEKYYFDSFGAYPESGEAPAYRELMEYKKALKHQALIENYNYIQNFKERFPKTAENLRRSIDYKTFNDPVWAKIVDLNREELNKELIDYEKENEKILTAQNAMTAFEVYAFNTKIAQFNQQRDYKLLRQYELRDEIEKTQFDLIVTHKQKTIDALTERSQKLLPFIQNVKCQFSTFKPSFTYYGEILRRDLNLRSQKFEDQIIEGVLKILNEIYPSAHDYFSPSGKIRFPKALDVAENIPWPNPVQMDNAYRMAIGFGTYEYALARFNEFGELLNELKAKNEEFFGRSDIPVQKGYFKLEIKNDRPTFPYVGPFIRMVEQKSEFFSETEKEGFVEIPGLGYLNFALMPTPISLGIDIAIDFDAKTAAMREYNLQLQEKLWQEKHDGMFLQKVLKPIGAVVKTFGHVIKYLNPYTLGINALKSNPFTARPFRELDKLTGGTLTGVNRVVQLPGRVMKGEPISSEQLLEAISYGLKAGSIIISGGSTAAIVGVAAGQLKNGSIAQSEFGRKMLGAIEIAGYIYAGSEALSKKFPDMTTDELVVQTSKDYAVKQGRSKVQEEVFKKSGIDKSVFGVQAGTALFSTLGPGAEYSFNLKEIGYRAGVGTLTTEAGKKVSEITYGVVREGSFQKYVYQYLPETANALPLSETQKLSQEILSQTDLYKKKVSIMDKIAAGKIPSLSELKTVHPEAKYFLDKLKQILPENQLTEGLDFGLNLGLPKFNLPDFGLPKIDLPNVDMPDFLRLPSLPSLSIPSIDLPSLSLPKDMLPSFDGKGFDFKLPDLEKLGIKIPKIPGTDIPLPDFKIPRVDLERLIKEMIPKGFPLYTGDNVDPYFFNFMDLDGAVKIRKPLSFSPYEHAMLRYGLIPRHYTKAQLEYMKLREMEYELAIKQLRAIELQQQAILSEIYNIA